MEKYCPQCGEKYRWFDSDCPVCRVPLADIPAAEAPNPRAELVTVMETTETGLVPLARLALEQAGIEYAIRNRGIAEQIFGSRTSMTIGETDTPLLVVVRAEDEARALEALADLGPDAAVSEPPEPAGGRAAGPAGPAGPAAATAQAGGAVALADAETGRPIGSITEAQFDSLASHLERESADDDDYYIDASTLALLEDKGADPDVVALLRDALGAREEMTVRWMR